MHCQSNLFFVDGERKNVVTEDVFRISTEIDTFGSIEKVFGGILYIFKRKSIKKQRIMLPINITELLGHNQDYKRAKYLRGRSLRSRRYRKED